jgi:hypothetical protein
MTFGYWNLPSETKNVFLPNPFFAGKIMYKSGDLGYWTEDMKVAYVGRIDNQVKVRGFRIEMEEIERALVRANPSVQTAAAIVVNGCRIVAFVTPIGINISAIRHKLKKLLPAYARPTQIITLGSLPQSSNLKTDRKALYLLATEHEDPGDNPTTPTEKIIAEIWNQVLDLQNDANKRQITRDDDFLAIGGNSLLAIKAARLISESIGHHTPVPLLIRETVLSNLAQAIDEHITKEELEPGFITFKSFLSDLSTPISLTVPQIPSQLEEELYLWHTISKTKSLFNTSFQFIIKGNVDVRLLNNILVSIIQENPILRARYVLNDGSLFRSISDEVTPPLVFSGSSFNTKKLQNLVDKPFDLAHDQLIRAVIWHQGGEHLMTKVSLSLITHHIITDKASLAILLQTVSQKYESTFNGTAYNGQNGDGNIRKGTYIEWTQWLEKNSTLPMTPITTTKRMFWKSFLASMPKDSCLKNQEVQILGHEIPCYKSMLIPTRDSEGFSQRMALAAASLTLFAIFGNNEIVLGIPYMNRDEPGSANLMGLFLDRLLVRVALNKSNMADSARLISDIMSEVNLSVENQLPYCEILQLAKDRKSPFDVVVIYHWQSDDLQHCLRIPEAHVSSERIRARGAKFPLQLEFSEQDDGLHCGIEYDARSISPTQMAAIISLIPKVVKGLAFGLAPAEIISSFNPLKHCNPLRTIPSYKNNIDKVCEAVSEALGIHLAEITPETTLFDLGGTSITALRLHYLLSKRGLLGDLRDILRGPSLREIAWIFQ